MPSTDHSIIYTSGWQGVGLWTILYLKSTGFTLVLGWGSSITVYFILTRAYLARLIRICTNTYMSYPPKKRGSARGGVSASWKFRLYSWPLAWVSPVTCKTTLSFNIGLGLPGGVCASWKPLGGTLGRLAGCLLSLGSKADLYLWNRKETSTSLTLALTRSLNIKMIQSFDMLSW